MLTKGQKIWAVSLALCFLGGLSAGLWIRRPPPVDPPAPEAAKPDTILIHDTLRLPAPPPMVVRVVDTIKVVLPDTSVTHQGDSAVIQLPMEESYYSGDGWKAWITGYQATLDSLFIDRTSTVIERPVYKTVTKHARWGVGAQVGATYVREQGVVPYIGLGVSYNILTF